MASKIAVLAKPEIHFFGTPEESREATTRTCVIPWRLLTWPAYLPAHDETLDIPDLGPAESRRDDRSSLAIMVIAIVKLASGEPFRQPTTDS